LSCRVVRDGQIKYVMQAGDSASQGFQAWDESTAHTSGDADAALDVPETLRSVPLLQQLGEAQVDALSQELTARAYTAGEAVVVEGEQGNEMYFLTEGGATAEVEGKVRDPSS
jgi:hypothetical protein